MKSRHIEFFRGKMTKVGNVESQRLLKVLEQLRDTVSVFTVITSQVSDSLEQEAGKKAAGLLGADWTGKLQEHCQLLEIYVAANTNREGNFSRITDDDDKEIKLNFDSVKSSTRDVTRRLKDASDITQELKIIQETKPVQFLQFIRVLSDFHDVVNRRLITTVEEDKARSKLVAQCLESEQAAIGKREALEKQLADLRVLKHQEHQDRTAKIAETKDQLLNESNSFIRRKAEIAEQLEHTIAKMTAENLERTTQLKAEIESANLQFQKQKDAAWFEEDALRRQKNRREVDIEAIIHKYDTEMERVTDAYELNLKDFKAEKDELLKLRTHFAAVDDDMMRVSQESALEDARLAKQAAAKAKLDEMATVLQSFWKGLVQREEYAKVLKAARKKGKKGKKGKKAKKAKGKEN